MKATELRIGNLVWDDYSGEMIVSQIYQSNVSLRKTINLSEGIYGIDNIEPIPLTEEWLLKLGFNHNADENEFYWLDEFSIAKRSDFEVFLNDEYICDLQYFHQLQNLYFALTGEELTIT